MKIVAKWSGYGDKMAWMATAKGWGAPSDIGWGETPEEAVKSFMQKAKKLIYKVDASALIETRGRVE